MRMFVALVLLASCLHTAVDATALRGLDPAIAALYEERKGGFKCLDGLRTVPFSQINDNYCDCFDGSDEPGTSACSNGKFYCANKGYEPKTIFASFVDDGVCDCCDGSDEPPGLCKDTCLDKGMAALDTLRSLVASKKAGLAVRASYLDQASRILADWQAQLDALKPEIDAQQTEVDMLKIELDAAEKVEREEQERARVEQEQRRKEEEARQAEEAAKVAATAGEAGSGDRGTDQAVHTEAGTVDVESDGTDKKEEQSQPPDIADTASNGGGDAAAGSEEDPDELGRRIASQWIKDEGEDAAEDTSSTDAGDDVLSHDVDDFYPDGEDEEDDYPMHDDHDYDDYDHYIPPTPDVEQSDEQLAEPTPERKTGPPPATRFNRRGLWGRVRAWVDTNILRKSASVPVSTTPGRTVATIRLEHTRANSQLRDLTSKRDKLVEKLGADYGPDKQFCALADKCFEGKFDKYTYSVCLYGKSAQKEGHSSTNLGSWKGFEDDYSYAVFDNGQHCWQGPNRSMKVHLVCGDEERVLKVEEPSRCEYTARMETPAVCKVDEVAALQAQLAAREAALRAVAGDEADQDQPHDEL